MIYNLIQPKRFIDSLEDSPSLESSDRFIFFRPNKYGFTINKVKLLIEGYPISAYDNYANGFQYTINQTVFLQTLRLRQSKIQVGRKFLGNIRKNPEIIIVNKVEYEGDFSDLDFLKFWYEALDTDIGKPLGTFASIFNPVLIGRKIKFLDDKSTFEEANQVFVTPYIPTGKFKGITIPAEWSAKEAYLGATKFVPSLSSRGMSGGNGFWVEMLETDFDKLLPALVQIGYLEKNDFKNPINPNVPLDEATPNGTQNTLPNGTPKVPINNTNSVQKYFTVQNAALAAIAIIIGKNLLTKNRESNE